MKYVFTADTHHLHKNIIELSHRPFSDVEEMTEQLIEKHNKVVEPCDVFFHLGDFAISYGKRDAGKIDEILSRMNGQKWLITGNHDRDEVTKNPRWHKVTPYHELKLDLGGEHKQRIVLCHYAMRVWNQSHRGAWMLHGHSHGNLPDIGGKILDVGVDGNSDYAPWTIHQITHEMNIRDIKVVDHHV